VEGGGGGGDAVVEGGEGVAVELGAGGVWRVEVCGGG
jgi:hypothetical protein